MAAAALVIAVLAVLAMAGGLWWEIGRGSRPDRVVSGLVRTQVVVTMLNGETFTGALDAADRTSVALLDAVMTRDTGGAAAVDGRLVLPRSGVRYMQFP